MSIDSKMQQSINHIIIYHGEMKIIILQVIQPYMGQDQSFGPKSPVGPAAARVLPAASAAPRPLPLPPPPAPPDTPAGRAVPQRLQTPRKAKFTLEQLFIRNGIRYLAILEN